MVVGAGTQVPHALQRPEHLIPLRPAILLLADAAFGLIVFLFLAAVTSQQSWEQMYKLQP